jgi:hypothetical protein
MILQSMKRMGVPVQDPCNSSSMTQLSRVQTLFVKDFLDIIVEKFVHGVDTESGDKGVFRPNARKTTPMTPYDVP